MSRRRVPTASGVSVLRVGPWRLRALLAVLAGALVVHELRYRLVGVEADAAAHAYLPGLQIAIATLFLGACVEFAVRLVRLTRGRPECGGEPPPARLLWPLFTTALVVLVAGQEAAELRWLGGHEHPGRDLATALISDGGWLVLPLSLLVGGFCALLLRGAAALARALRPGTHRQTNNPRRLRITEAPGWRPIGAFIARNIAGRGPPLLA